MQSGACDLIAVSGGAKALGVFVAYTTIERLRYVGGDPLAAAVDEVVASLRSRLTLDGLKDDPVVRAYRDFYWRLGIDPTKVRPSSEALARRALRGGFPRVSPLVDAGNAASAATLVPIGIYDLDRLSPPLTIRLSDGGEEFSPIGGRPTRLPRGYPIMADSRGLVVHLYAHRDSEASAVRESTARALVVGAGVPGVPRELVRRAVELTVELAARAGWDRSGPLCEV